MSIIIGIDAGISSTKIIGIENGERIMAPMTVKSSDASTAIYGALGKYLNDNDTTLESVDQVMLTGIGAKDLKSPILGRPTAQVDEFIANVTRYAISAASAWAVVPYRAWHACCWAPVT